MKDKDKTKEQLIAELAQMSQRITEFEVSEVEGTLTKIMV